MSGYFGIVRTDGGAVGEDFLKKIARVLEFRGPDGSCTHAKDGIGFSFAVLNLNTSRQARVQPVRLGDRFWLIGEVRLDARRELVTELHQKRQPVSAESPDEELLLYAWSVWDEACLPKVLGDFSFGLWDAKRQSLFCARDFAGAKPLFYASAGGVFCFTNTLQVLQDVSEIPAELDDLFVRDFLVDGLSGDPERTVWHDVHRLPAGHRLYLSHGNLEITLFGSCQLRTPCNSGGPANTLKTFRNSFKQPWPTASRRGSALFI